MEEIEKKKQEIILLPIEKGIPLPEVERKPKWRRPIRYKIAIDRLDVGDSVFIPGATQPPQKEMHYLKMRMGRLFSFRVIKDDLGNLEGIRVWRVL
jgi:hypothetical protein